MIAAILDLDVGTRARAEAVHHVQSCFLDAHDVVDGDTLEVRLGEAAECSGLHFLGVADHMIDLGHVGELLGLDLSGAAGDDDAGVGAIAARPADRLPGLAHGLARDGAGVDDDAVLERRVRPRDGASLRTL